MEDQAYVCTSETLLVVLADLASAGVLASEGAKVTGGVGGNIPNSMPWQSEKFWSEIREYYRRAKLLNIAPNNYTPVLMYIRQNLPIGVCKKYVASHLLCR